MAVEEKIKSRITQLIAEGGPFRQANEFGQHISDLHVEASYAWVVAALHVVRLVCPDAENAYRQTADHLVQLRYPPPVAIGVFIDLLRLLARDIDDGLLTSISDSVRAQTFDDFLDHATAYYSKGRKVESGVIASVVFEHTVREICRKHQIEEKDRKLDELISALSRARVFSGLTAKQGRVAAHVRTKATHAQWDEFDLSAVQGTIELTKKLLSDHLDR